MNQPHADDNGLYIVMLSIHGLIRGHDLELGRDADTGGQVLYVIEMARALAAHPRVAQVDLLTRRVADPKVSRDYAQPEEELADGARIVRIPCGPRRYLRKESLWPYLDGFVDQALQHLGRVGRMPDVIHGHYADAGYVGAQLASILGLPFLFTGHSLGRVKKERLVHKGMNKENIEQRYRIGTRIEAEEIALETADRVITSTHQEVDEQYALYHRYQPERMVVIPPGVDLSRFSPPPAEVFAPPIGEELKRFLRDPGKPMVLTIARPDERKNLHTLVQAFAEHERLRAEANLVVVAGCREDIRQLDRGARQVLQGLLLAFDTHDLYGAVAYPKQHQSEDVPDLYRLAAATEGVFVNPALTEPFGLTLLEAAASGVPVVATEDGGPRDIISLCHHGRLVDPLDPAAIGEAIYGILHHKETWRELSRNAVENVHEHFTWGGHVKKYLQELDEVARHKQHHHTAYGGEHHLIDVDRLLITDIDNTLIGDEAALEKLKEVLAGAEAHIGFGIATGRHLELTVEALKEWDIPIPDILLTSVGTEIYYGPGLTQDKTWRNHLNWNWQPEAVREILAELPGLTLQPEENQRRYKVSYYLDRDEAPPRRKIIRFLREKGMRVSVVQSHGSLLDITPIRASKGNALRYLSWKWSLPAERILVAGDSGNDEDMLQGNMLGVVVGNYSRELRRLRGRPRIYFAEGRHAYGILEGMEHYNFLHDIRIPEEETYDSQPV